MNKSNYIVAIEIGSSKIKGAVGQVDPSGTLIVKGIEEERLHPNYVRYGCVQNLKEVANELNRVVAKLNNRIAPAKISAVYVGVGGRSLKSTPARLSMSLADDTEITPEIVESLLGRAKIAGTDAELLDVEPTEFIIDGKSQGIDPVGNLARELAANVTLVSCRQQIRRNLQLAINEKLNLPINGFVVRPMAEADLVLSSEEKRLGAMLVDCGAETTTVAIYKGGALIYLATIPLGSRHITRDLMTLPTLEEKAEEIKRTLGNANPDESHRGGSPDEIDTSKINKIISSRASEIAVNISAQIGYADLKPGDLPRGIVIIGGGSQLQGFAELLARTTAMDVRRGALPATVRLTGPKISSGEDLDVISLLYRLAGEEKLRPCTVVPEPVRAPETETVNVAGNDTDDDEEEIEDLPQPKGNFFKNFWSKLKNGPDDLGEFNDD